MLVTRKRSMFNQNKTDDIDGDVLLSDDERQDNTSEGNRGDEEDEYGAATRVHKSHHKRMLRDLDDTESVIQQILLQETNHPGSSRAKR